jgi:hypothetical protein
VSGSHSIEPRGVARRSGAGCVMSEKWTTLKTTSVGRPVSWPTFVWSTTTMVFAPNRRSAVEPSADAVLDAQLTAKAARGRSAVHPPGVSRRVAWRAVVHPRDRDGILTEWHLAGCAGPHAAHSHCAEGQRLIQSVGQPEGHCLIEGRCALCHTGVSVSSILTGRA